MSINDSKYMAGGRTIKSYLGSHVVEVVGVDGGETFAKKEKFIIRVVVRASTNEQLKEDLAGGSELEVADPIVMNSYPDYFYTDIRGFLGALEDHDPADGAFDWATHKDRAEAGEYNGRLLGAEVWETGKTVKSGKRAGEAVNNVTYSAPPKKG